MKIEELSDGAAASKNEDLIFVHRHNDSLSEIIIMDAASSVADKHYIDAVDGDPAWFVLSFASALKQLLTPGLSPEENTLVALGSLRKEFGTHTVTKKIPTYAHPLAAMTWIRATELDDKVSLQIYALGDCKILLVDGSGQVSDLDPYKNPEEDRLKDEIENLKRAGIVDGSERRNRLLPMIRARREFLNTTNSPTVLCVNPQGRFNAREYMHDISKDSKILAMTDGFYRLVDTYNLYSNQDLVHECVSHGLEKVLAQLRDHEKSNREAGDQSVKKADDASALICSFGM